MTLKKANEAAPKAHSDSHSAESCLLGFSYHKEGHSLEPKFCRCRRAEDVQSSYVALKTKARSKCTVGHCGRTQDGMFEGQTQPVLRLYTHRRAWRFIVKTLAAASAACEEPYCECQTVWRSQDLNRFKYSPGVLKTFFSEKFVKCNGTGFVNGK